MDHTCHPGLAGKVALVTGGSRGLGAATCQALATHGVRVAVGGRDTTAIAGVVAAITAAGGTAVAAPGDATDAGAVRRVRETAEAALGPVDILVPFAGGQGRPAPTAELGAARWRATIESDLTSVFLAVGEILPGMLERRSGVIVTMSSTAGRHPGGANAAYAAAKAGVVMFSEHLAAEVAPHGIRVNCLAPSAVRNDRMPPGVPERLAARFPLGRIGEPADIAAAVLFLTSDAASWITGVTLDLTGGRVIA